MVGKLIGNSVFPTTVVLAVALWLGALAKPSCPQDSKIENSKIVLRDFTIINANEIQFDQHGVITGDGATYQWDQILSAELTGKRQNEFNSNLAKIGLPMFRVRHRLSNGDWNSLPEIVEDLYQQQKSQLTTKANQRNKYIVSVATAYGRLASNDRIRAVVPFVESCRIRKSFPMNASPIFTHDLTDEEIQQHFTTRLLPIWFDNSNVEETIGEFEKAFGSDIRRYTAGTLIYHASLTLAAKKIQRANQSLSELSARSTKLVKIWLPILQVQREIQLGEKGQATIDLRTSYKKSQGPARAVANYLLAIQVGNQKDEYDTAVLDLLYIPAVHAKNTTFLSAAALDLAATISEKAERTDEAILFRKELLDRYPNTYHGKLQRMK